MKYIDLVVKIIEVVLRQVVFVYHFYHFYQFDIFYSNLLDMLVVFYIIIIFFLFSLPFFSIVIVNLHAIFDKPTILL